MMALLHVGPDGGLILYGLVISIALALLAWRRVGRLLQHGGDPPQRRGTVLQHLETKLKRIGGAPQHAATLL